MLDHTGRGRKRIIAGTGGQENQVEIGRTHPRSSQGPLRRFHRQIGTGFTGTGHMPLADTGPLDDPFVRGGHHPFQIGISQHFGRHIGAGPGNAGPHAETSPAGLG